MSKARKAERNEELEVLLSLLQKEKEADFEQHRRKVQQLPMAERVAQGYTWYPVQVIKMGFALGERAYVIIERAGELEKHHFRAGKVVQLFSRQPNAKPFEKTGVIHYVQKNRMKIILNAKDLPEWIGLGQVGVDLMFDETTYLEMEKALRQVMKASGNRLAELRAVLLGQQAARFTELPTIHEETGLNASQLEAVSYILAAQDVAVVHGPPGTGKTTTIVQAVRLLCRSENTVLVAAPSNTAADLLTERLAGVGLEVVRIGNLSRVDESILRHTLEMKLAAHPDSKHIKKVKIQAAEARQKAGRYKRHFGYEERSQRQRLMDEAKELMSWAKNLEDRLLDQILSSADVITCTLVGAASRVLDKMHFRTVVIDEAAQALEPATWIPILKASRVVLTGDPFQLPPTIMSAEARRGGLEVTLIEKCLQRIPLTKLLRVQYRMSNPIMGFSNERFYKGQLEAAPGIDIQRLPIAQNTPIVFIDTAGCGFDELTHELYQSRYNPSEFQILCEHLYQLLDAFEGNPELPSIALISPYREQVVYITDAVAADPRLAHAPITINTIDGFQGQERDVVYISLVRSNTKTEIGFLSDYRRMNVAMTRARLQLIIVGDSATIGANPFYGDLLIYCELYGKYMTAWEYML